jgi:hypothetical protein
MLGSESQAWNASNSGRTRQFAAQSCFIGATTHQLGAVGGKLLASRLGFDQFVIQNAFRPTIALPLVIEVYAWHDHDGRLWQLSLVEVGTPARRGHGDLSGQFHHLAILSRTGLIGEFMAATPHGVGGVLRPQRHSAQTGQDANNLKRFVHCKILLGTMKKGGTRPPLVTGFETGD